MATKAKATTEIYIRISKGAKKGNKDTVQHAAKTAEEAIKFIKANA